MHNISSPRTDDGAIEIDNACVAADSVTPQILQLLEDCAPAAEERVVSAYMLAVLSKTLCFVAANMGIPAAAFVSNVANSYERQLADDLLSSTAH